MINPFLVFSPAAAMVGAQAQHRHGGAAAMQDPLSMLVELVDSADFTIVMYTIFMAFSFVMSILSFLLVFVLQPHFNPLGLMVWQSIGFVSFAIFLVTLVLLVEPRPSHWLPFLESAIRVCRKCHPAEIRERLRSWWRWRNKYEAQKRTKLNV
jgi:hypothetical protein